MDVCCSQEICQTNYEKVIIRYKNTKTGSDAAKNAWKSSL